MKRLALILTLCCAVGYAQQSTPPAPTELQQTKLQLYATQMQLLQSQFNNLQQQQQAVISQMEREHPGYHWNGQALIADPTPAPAAKK